MAHDHTNRTGKKNPELKSKRDRFKKLPVELIILIISLLEMKDVVRTSILSKMWKDLWTQVHTIVYRYHIMGENREEDGEASAEQLSSYANFIDHTLMRCVLNIKQFSLNGMVGSFRLSMSREVAPWLQYVLEKKVEILKLKGLAGDISDFLFQCSSLTELKLTLVQITLSTPAGWPLLKSLFIKRTFVEEASLINMLLGCPVLQTLVLKDVCVLNYLRITSPTLKNVHLVNIQTAEGSDDFIVEISAPLLQDLEISSSFNVKTCTIMDTSSLMKATLKFSIFTPPFVYAGFSTTVVVNLEVIYDWCRTVAKLFTSICHIDELVIGSDLLQILSLSVFYGPPFPTLKCKHLEIDSPLWTYDYCGIDYLLQHMPHLEFLVIYVSGLEYPYHVDQPFNILTGLISELDFQHVNLKQLKSVKIDYQRNPSTDSDFSLSTFGECLDFQFLRYIFRSSYAIKSLVICSSNPCCFDTECLELTCAFRYVSDTSSEVSDLLCTVGAGEWKLTTRKFAFEYCLSN